jgi:hypothetical protein
MRPHLAQINQCAKNARREATDFPIGGLALTRPTTEWPLPKMIFYGIAITTSLLLTVFLLERQPRLVTASHFMANDTVNVRAVEGRVDVKALPGWHIPPEAYQ